MSNITATPTEIKINDDCTLTFSPLTLGDILESRDWAIKRLRHELGIPAGIADQIAQMAEIKASDAPESECNTPAGWLHQVWLSARKHHKDLTEEQLAELIPVEQLLDCMIVVNNLSSVSDPNEATPEAEQPKAKAAKAKSATTES